VYDHGIAINVQLKTVSHFLRIVVPNKINCTSNFGMVYLNLQKLSLAKASFFDAHKTNLKLLKFVPASGAASRMFKFF
jgi:hypothetical protein